MWLAKGLFVVFRIMSIWSFSVTGGTTLDAVALNPPTYVAKDSSGFWGMDYPPHSNKEENSLRRMATNGRHSTFF